MQYKDPNLNAEKTPLKSPQGDNSFPKKEKLTHKTVFEKLFSEGKTLKEFPVKLLYLNTSFPDAVPVKVAVVAPKKKFKNLG